MPKIVKGGPFGLFPDPFSCKKSKKMKEGPFGDISKFWEKKSHSAEKKSKGGLFSLVRFCRLRYQKDLKLS